MSYILITPIRDEVENLLKLKETIFSQTVKPLIWVIGDGNSKDGSYQFAKELFKDYNWIHVIKQTIFFEDGYSHKNFSGNINNCLIYAKKICIENNINYSFIGKADATPLLADNYFEVLIEEMKNDPKLAFICGLQKLHFKNSIKVFNQVAGISNTGINDLRLYRKEFLEEMGGYPLSYSPDTVLQIKALNRGWRITFTKRTYFIKNRMGGAKIGMWNGYKLKGRGMYSLGYHPFLALLNAIFFSVKFPPHYQGIAVIHGYFINFFSNEDKINDLEVKDYFWNRRLKEIIQTFSNKFKMNWNYKDEKTYRIRNPK